MRRRELTKSQMAGIYSGKNKRCRAQTSDKDQTINMAFGIYTCSLVLLVYCYLLLGFQFSNNYKPLGSFFFIINGIDYINIAQKKKLIEIKTQTNI